MAVTTVNSLYRAYAKINGKEVQNYFPLTVEGRLAADSRQEELDAFVRLAVSQRKRRIFREDGSIIGVKLKCSIRKIQKDGYERKPETFFLIQKNLDKKSFKKRFTIGESRTFKSAFDSSLEYIFSILSYTKEDVAQLHSEIRAARRFYLDELSGNQLFHS